MRLSTSLLLCCSIFALAGCSGSNSEGTEAKTQEARVVPAGEKAVAGHLTYNIVDSQVLPRLGDEANPRIPHDRFMLVQVSVSNSSNTDNPIPSMELVDDSGRIYNEMTDGAGVANWLGIVRKVGAGQTERGNVAFDAPAAHYRLKVSDETLSQEFLADLPLNFQHERINDSIVPGVGDVQDNKPSVMSAPDQKK